MYHRQHHVRLAGHLHHRYLGHHPANYLPSVYEQPGLGPADGEHGAVCGADRAHQVPGTPGWLRRLHWDVCGRCVSAGAVRNANANSHGNGNRDGYCNADSNSYVYTDSDSNGYSYGYIHADADSYGYPHADAYTNSDGNSNCDSASSNADSDAYGSAEAVTDATAATDAGASPVAVVLIRTV